MYLLISYYHAHVRLMLCRIDLEVEKRTPTAFSTPVFSSDNHIDQTVFEVLMALLPHTLPA
jgi:hypothetical protein